MDAGNNNLSSPIPQLLRNSTLARVLDMRMSGFEAASLKCLQMFAKSCDLRSLNRQPIRRTLPMQQWEVSNNPDSINCSNMM
ncbi:hypothetical protein WN943_009751 [Citrus x changshan-huyou]